MSSELISQPGADYAAAHAAHYVAKDLRAAVEQYSRIITTHAGSREAEYSRTQIHNIARALIPKDRLLSEHLELVRAQIDAVGD